MLFIDLPKIISSGCELRDIELSAMCWFEKILPSMKVNQIALFFEAHDSKESFKKQEKIITDFISMATFNYPGLVLTTYVYRAFFHDDFEDYLYDYYILEKSSNFIVLSPSLVDHIFLSAENSSCNGKLQDCFKKIDSLRKKVVDIDEEDRCMNRFTWMEPFAWIRLNHNVEYELIPTKKL